MMVPALTWSISRNAMVPNCWTTATSTCACMPHTIAAATSATTNASRLVLLPSAVLVNAAIPWCCTAATLRCTCMLCTISFTAPAVINVLVLPNAMLHNAQLVWCCTAATPSCARMPRNNIISPLSHPLPLVRCVRCCSLPLQQRLPGLPVALQHC